MDDNKFLNIYSMLEKRLTRKEKEIIRLLFLNCPIEQIGKYFGMSLEDINLSLLRIYSKLHVEGAVGVIELLYNVQTEQDKLFLDRK